MTRVTIVDVAREAGVAISTVSAALNGRPGVSSPTRERVLAVADRLGWVPSVRGRSLSSRRSYSVGMVLHRAPRVLEADPFFWGFIGGVEEELDRRGYTFVLQTAPTAARTHDRIRDLALSKGVDGVFLTDVRIHDPRFDLVAELGLPAVAINVPGGCPVLGVTQGHADALVELMAGLIKAGHRRIAHVSGPPDYVHAVEREGIWRQAVREAGLSEEYLVRGDFTTEGGVAAADDLLGRDVPPTAVVCANDLSAVGFLIRARSRGLAVPADVSVAGFDDIALARYTTPALTTVRTDPHELGLRAARVLIDRVEGGPGEHVTIAPATLVWRDSTGPVSGG